METRNFDAVVVGAGPNGFAAAITLARTGRSVLLLEGSENIGGGAQTAALTLPGFRHDACSAIHPLALISRFFRTLPTLQTPRSKLRWVESPIVLAHPFDDGSAVTLNRSIIETAQQLGSDALAYQRLFDAFAPYATELADDLFGPLRMPKHPYLAARFGFLALRSAIGLAQTSFTGEPAKALFAGTAAHAGLPLTRSTSAATGLVLLLLGHAVGWPFPEGGSQNITDFLAQTLQQFGGKIVTNHLVTTLSDIPPANLVLFNTSPSHFAHIADTTLTPRFIKQLRRFRYGVGVFKIDYALDGPIPWRTPQCHQTATVHVGGTMNEIASAEADVAADRTPERPFVILCQQSLFDPTRAPAGKQTAWAYCHVPRDSPIDMTERIERQIERFAPGFRDRILARSITTPQMLAQHNPNNIGGAIDGGLMDLRQLYLRPRIALRPYRTSNPRFYLCSSSTPPGGGVHGLCGYYAAQTALHDLGNHHRFHDPQNVSKI